MTIYTVYFTPSCELQQAQGMSARTRNTYTASLKAFVQWAIKEGRLLNNPLTTLGKARESEDVRRQRRALRLEELARLIEAARIRPLRELQTIRIGPNRGKLVGKVSPETARKAERLGQERALCYQMAALTGLRRNELAQLQWGDLRLDTESPYIALRGDTTKNRRADTLFPFAPNLPKLWRPSSPQRLCPGPGCSRRYQT